MEEWKKCSACFNEITIVDFVDNKCYHIGNNVFCEKCFDNMEDNVFFCERCCVFDYKNDNYIETKDINNDVNYYHIKCLFETEKCPICKDYVKNKECVYVFVDYGCKIEYHKGCIEDKNNVFKFDICDECSISLRVKCESCNHRFMDCYNVNCVTYGCHNCDDRYDGNCGSCNW